MKELKESFKAGIQQLILNYGNRWWVEVLRESFLVWRICKNFLKWFCLWTKIEQKSRVLWILEKPFLPTHTHSPCRHNFIFWLRSPASYGVSSDGQSSMTRPYAGVCGVDVLTFSCVCIVLTCWWLFRCWWLCVFFKATQSSTQFLTQAPAIINTVPTQSSARARSSAQISQIELSHQTQLFSK